MPLFRSKKSEEVKKEEKLDEGIKVDPVPHDYEVLKRYPVKEDFAEVVIAAKPGIILEPVYFVNEVQLAENEYKALEKLKDFLSKELEPPSVGEEEDVKKILLDSADKLIKKYGKAFGIISEESKKKLFYYLERDMLGFGVLNVIMEDYHIEDISCDGVNVPIYVWHRDFESLPTNITFTDRKVLDDFIIQLAHKAGKHISSAFPMLDAMIYGKHRLAATFREEVSPRGSTFTIRKFREKPFSITELLQSNVMNTELAAYFWLLLENKANIMVAGATGSGKTTLLNALSCFIKPRMKIVTCEETAELNMPTENWVRFVTRESYGLGATKTGEIALYDLVKMSLRYRPDYLIVGEIRGEEAFVLFQAIASVSGDTPVLIKDAKSGHQKLIPIGEFIDQFYNPAEERVPKYVEGFDVMTLSPSGKVCWKPIRYVLRHKTDKIYRVRYVGGEIKVTGSHSVFVLDEDSLEVKVKEVKQLKRGDILVSFLKRYEEDLPNPKLDLIELLGDPYKDFVDGLPADLKALTGYNPTSLSTYLQYEHSYEVRNALEIKRWYNGKWAPVVVEVDEDLAFVMGVYLANGCVKEHRSKCLCFSLGASGKNIEEKLIKVFREKFNLNPTIENRGSHHLIKFKSPIIAELFEKLMGRKLEEKHLPSFLWCAPRKIINAFLRGYTADSRRNIKNRRKICSKTKSWNLASEISWLARIAGLNSYIVKEKNRRQGEYYSIYVSQLPEEGRSQNADLIPLKPILKLHDRLNLCNMPWGFTYLFKNKRRFVGRKVVREVLDWILEKRRNKLEKEDYKILIRIKTLLESDIVLAPVLEIAVEDYQGYVYDISVPESEAFYGGSTPVLLHNTGHGGLSTVHAENIEAAMRRLTSPPMNIPPSHISLLDVMCLVERTLLPRHFKGATFGRRLRYVWEIVNYDQYNLIAEWNPVNDTFTVDLAKSVILDEIALRWGRTKMDMLREIARRKAVLEWMVKKNIIDINEVARVVYSYYTDSERFIREVGIRVEEIPVQVIPTKVREIPDEKLELAIDNILDLLKANNGIVPYYQVFTKIPLSKDIIVEALKQLRDSGAIIIESMNVKLRETYKTF